MELNNGGVPDSLASGGSGFWAKIITLVSGGAFQSCILGELIMQACQRFSRACFAKALQLLCGETQRKARGGATQHTMLSGSAAGLICVPCIFDRRKLSGEATRWRLC